MSVLVDSSVWIDYFRGKGDTAQLDDLLDEGLPITNDLILSELVPPLKIQKQTKVVSLLCKIEKAPILIDWDQIIDMQVRCLRKGLNKVGIPDLVIAQNCIQNSLKLYSFDKHFKLMSKYIGLDLL